MSKNLFVKENSPGLVATMIALVLVVACIIGVAWIAPNVIAYFKTDNVPQPTQPIVLTEGNLEKWVETGSTVEIIDTEVFPSNNCSSSSPTEIQTERARTVEHIVTINGQGGIEMPDNIIDQIPFLKLLKVSLELSYGVHDNQVEERSYTIKFVTGAHTQATHTTRWKYSWHQGEATVRLPDGATQVYAFRVRTSLEPETTSEETACP